MVKIKFLEMDTNVAINGDSLHGLKLMKDIREFDLIMINPPKKQKDDYLNIIFNTVEEHYGEIEKRMTLARELLSDNGAIIVHSDEHSYPELRILMNRIFGEKNYVNTFILKNDNNEVSHDNDKINAISSSFDFEIIYKKSDSFYYKNPYKDIFHNEGQFSLKTIITTNMMDYQINSINCLKKLILMFTNSNSSILDYYGENSLTAQAIVELNENEDEYAKRSFVIISETRSHQEFIESVIKSGIKVENIILN